MRLHDGIIILIIFVIALATPLLSQQTEETVQDTAMKLETEQPPATSQETAKTKGFISIFPQMVQSWVEIKVDSLSKADSLAQMAARVALDSVATEQGVSFDEGKVKYFKSYLGLWTEMEGRGRRKRPVQKGYIVRMKASAPIIKEK